MILGWEWKHADLIRVRAVLRGIKELMQIKYLAQYMVHINTQ